MKRRGIDRRHKSNRRKTGLGLNRSGVKRIRITPMWNAK